MNKASDADRKKCNFGIPCNHCLKVAGSSVLGQALCTRQNLMTARFNNVGMTLYNVLKSKEILCTKFMHGRSLWYCPISTAIR